MTLGLHAINIEKKASTFGTRVRYPPLPDFMPVTTLASRETGFSLLPPNKNVFPGGAQLLRRNPSLIGQKQKFLLYGAVVSIQVIRLIDPP